MLNVGVIGLGEIGQIHARAILESSSARISIACDVAEGSRSAMSSMGVRTTARLEEVLERDDVDVVTVCLPPKLHYSVASAALAAGKHVLLEKPMATTIDECDRLIEAAAKAGLVLGVSHNRLFVPANIRAKELIETGKIGEPVLLRQRLGVEDTFTGWRADPANWGGLVSDCAAHQFYVAEHLFGDIRRVKSLLDVPSTEGESLAVVWMEFESGAQGLLEANYWCPPGMFDDSLEVIGSAGVLRLGGLEATTFAYRSDAPLEYYHDRKWSTVDVPFVDWPQSVILSVQAYLEALNAGRPVPTPGEDGRDNVRHIHAAYNDSILLGRFARPSLSAARSTTT